MQRRNKRSVTIQDVAKAAGVSVTTVSRVLNDRADVAPDTYDRVKEVILEMGYTSSLAARSMRSLKMDVIGLIMPDVQEPFPVQVMKGVNRAIEKLDYDLLIYTSGNIRKHYDDDREGHYVALLNNSIIDGVIVVTPASRHFMTNSPVVAVDPHYENTEYPAVISTNWDGAMAAMSYLISLGHRRIGYIGGRPDLQSANRRLLAYRDSLERAGIALDADLIVEGDFTAETGLACARTLLGLPERPTAIFAANDRMALSVYQAAQEAGLRIPQDLSVIGFDNIPEAALADPGLTTVDQSIEEMGFIATQMLIKLIEGVKLDSNLYKTSTRLVVRRSCQAPEGAGR
jgi:LacI family transcriptional regulator